ncbi:MAG: hypothetical protein AYK18_11600 [Theionarchaea archaeon DG-70]|nr:MAG: hypothetical protein AYK18_11600 [Theionarchaea archaeon DG-70]
MISAIDDILEDFSLYLRVERRISPGVARCYRYSLGRFLRWADTINPDRHDAVKYMDKLMKDGKKESTLRNILFALKHYYQFIGKELDLKPPKRPVRQVDYLTVMEAKSLVYTSFAKGAATTIESFIYLDSLVDNVCE